MTGYLLKMFGISLGLTLLFEIPVGFLWGLRGWKYLALTVLVNVLTNPPAVMFHWLGVPQVPIEIVVFLVEAGIYAWFSKDEKWLIRKPVLLSLTANGISWTLGILLSVGGLL